MKASLCGHLAQPRLKHHTLPLLSHLCIAKALPHQCEREAQKVPRPAGDSLKPGSTEYRENQSPRKEKVVLHTVDESYKARGHSLCPPEASEPLGDDFTGITAL